MDNPVFCMPSCNAIVARCCFRRCYFHVLVSGAQNQDKRPWASPGGSSEHQAAPKAHFHQLRVQTPKVDTDPAHSHSANAVAGLTERWPSKPQNIVYADVGLEAPHPQHNISTGLLSAVYSTKITRILQWFAELGYVLASWKIHIVGKGALEAISFFYCIFLLIVLYPANKEVHSTSLMSLKGKKNEGRKWKHNGKQSHRQHHCSLPYFLTSFPNTRLLQDYLHHNSSQRPSSYSSWAAKTSHSPKVTAREGKNITW